MKTSSRKEGHDRLSETCELVGRYLYYFSRMELELDRCIMKVFCLKQDAANILTADMPIGAKLDIVGAMIESQFSGKQRLSLLKILNKIRDVNQEDRVTIAHSTFEAHGKDTVRFHRLTVKQGKRKLKSPAWTTTDFKKKFDKLEEWSSELRQLVNELEPYVPSLDFSDPQNSMYLALI